MKAIKTSPRWFDSRFEYCIDGIRIYLGLGLLIRGFLYIGGEGRSLLFDQINSIGATWAIPYLIGHYIILAHLVGGLLLMLGLLTRAMAVIQIPILLGAACFVHRADNLLMKGEGLEFSILVLVLLVVISLCGPGRLSMDVTVFHRVKN